MFFKLLNFVLKNKNRIIRNHVYIYIYRKYLKIDEYVKSENFWRDSFLKNRETIGYPVGSCCVGPTFPAHHKAIPFSH